MSSRLFSSGGALAQELGAAADDAERVAHLVGHRRRNRAATPMRLGAPVRFPLAPRRAHRQRQPDERQRPERPLEPPAPRSPRPSTAATDRRTPRRPRAERHPPARRSAAAPGSSPRGTAAPRCGTPTPRGVPGERLAGTGRDRAAAVFAGRPDCRARRPPPAGCRRRGNAVEAVGLRDCRRAPPPPPSSWSPAPSTSRAAVPRRLERRSISSSTDCRATPYRRAARSTAPEKQHDGGEREPERGRARNQTEPMRGDPLTARRTRPRGRRRRRP